MPRLTLKGGVLGRQVEHNPKMQQHWHPVDVERPLRSSKDPYHYLFAGQVVNPHDPIQAVTIKEIRASIEASREHDERVVRAMEWCAREIRGRWTVGREQFPYVNKFGPGVDHRRVFRFFARRDAILFKLAFNGI